jgi:hypothetical protein
MDKIKFRKRLNALITEVLDDQFDDEENNSFSDFWEAIRDKVDSVADDEDIDDAAEDEDIDEDDYEDPDDLNGLDVE